MATEGMALGDLYTEVIGEHSRAPENKGALETATVRERGHNPSCGDEITLELEIADGVIKDGAFTGVGCAISQASTDIMIDLMRGKTVEEVALKNISNMPARVKCAVLAWHTLEDVLKEGQTS